MIPKTNIGSLPFEQRLAFGRFAENLSLKAVQKYLDNKAYLIKGWDKEKDIVAPTLNLRFEVKDQRNAVKCLSVEFAKLYPDGHFVYTGIKVSKADYWIYYCKNELIVINGSWFYGLLKSKKTKITQLEANPYKNVLKIVDIAEVRQLSDYIWQPELDNKQQLV